MIINGVRVSRQAFVGDPFIGVIGQAVLRTGVTALARRGATTALARRPGIAITAPRGSTTAAGIRILPGAGTIAAPRGGVFGRIVRAGVSMLPGAPVLDRAFAGGRRLPSGFADTGRRRRRMNPLNPRALRRALSRAGAFEKFCRRTLVITRRVKLKRRAKKR